MRWFALECYLNFVKVQWLKIGNKFLTSLNIMLCPYLFEIKNIAEQMYDIQLNFVPMLPSHHTSPGCHNNYGASYHWN